MRRNPLQLFSLVLLTISVCFLNACNDDEAASDIIGTWVISSVLQSNCTDDSDNGTTEPTCTDEDCTRIIFSEGNEYVIQTTTGGTTRRDAGTFSIDGSSIDLCEEDEGQSICNTFSLSVSSNSLVLTATDNTSGCQVRTTYTRES